MIPEPQLPAARPILVKPVTLALVVLLLAACGSRTGGAADDPAGDAAAVPAQIPAAPGAVRTRGVVTVLDDGTRPEVCLGPIAESWPPQCSGPPLIGWDWRQQRLVLGQPGGPPAGYEQGAGVRWGQFALIGRWDGESFTLGTAIPAAQYEPPTEEQQPLPEPEESLDEQALQRLAGELMDLPGALSSYARGGRAYVDVVYDDGSLQQWAEARHGRGVVVVSSALLDVPEPE